LMVIIGRDNEFTESSDDFEFVRKFHNFFNVQKLNLSFI
jgi:hypothetical protein